MELVHAIHDLGLRQHWQLLVNTSLAIKRIHDSALGLMPNFPSNLKNFSH